MDHKNSNQLYSLVSQVDTTLDPYFTNKAPQLPSNIRELLVTLTPYFTILGVVLAVIGLLVLVGVSAFASPFLLMFAGVSGASAVGGEILSIIFMAVQAGLEAMAIPGLFKHQRSAWQLLFMAAIVGALYNLVTMNLISLVINFLISFYILYQIKGYYK